MVRYFVATAAVLALAACAATPAGDTTASTSTPSTQTAPAASAATSGAAADTFVMPSRATRTLSGLRYVIDRPGTGPAAVQGQMVRVHYTGWMTNGTKFDSSRDRGTPYEFPLGAGRVIKGWDEGVAGMKVGERRTLIVPPELAYGANGYGGLIPPNATLVFQVELVGTR
jgi:peptidylprolyl isomerase